MNRKEWIDVFIVWMFTFIMLIHVQSCARAMAELPKIPATVLAGPKSTSDKSQLFRAMDEPLKQIGFAPKDERVTCGRPIVVAVVDTGIDYTHPLLQDLIWVNTKEIPDNGIDDDKNGFVDDVIGWDFVHDKPLPYDQHGHGTHISGIIEMASSYGKMECNRVQLMALKFYDNSGAGFNNLANTVRAFEYAAKNGADIINYSGGGHDPSPSELAALNKAYKKDIFLVGAAGNDGTSLSDAPYYPASYPILSIIGVASLNKMDELLPSSSFGPNVEFGAPGLSIISLAPEKKFNSMSGTSQATAFVTGALAFLLSQKPGPIHDKADQVRAKLSKGSAPYEGNELHDKLEWGKLYMPNLINK